MSWIDFKALRRDINFAHVLDHYRVEVKVKGDRASCFCPLPDHKGKRRSPSFSADLKRGLFQCFGCGAKGNVIEFACLMEKLDPQDPRQFFKAAGVLKDRFLGNGQSERKRDPGRRPEKRERAPEKPRSAKPQAPRSTLPVLVNPPLDFELRLEPEHVYLRDRGFTPETVKHFGLGFANRGSLKDRIAIPLHDAAGKLVGYAGRVIDDSLISAENPKYLFPSERERDGKLLQFKKSLFLYNGWRFRKPVTDLVVVEGFPSVWWLWQNSVSNVVALMGNACSKEQGKLIVTLVEPTGTVWVFTDGDDAGRRCAGSVFLAVGAHRLTRLVLCDEGKQPTDWEPEELLGSFAAFNEESGTSDEPIGARPCEKSTDEADQPTAAE